MKSDIARLCLGSAPYTLLIEPQKIIDCAHEAGIRWFDAATAYRDHDGSICGADGIVPEEWNVVLKLKAKDLKQDAFFEDAQILLAHEPQAEHLVRAYKAVGYKGKIGVSVYRKSEIYRDEYDERWIEAVQYPLNIADRHFAGWQPLSMLRFARSIFLQGKLLQMGYSVSDCLGYVLRQPVDYAVVGVNSVKEMEEIIRAAEALPEHVPEIPAPKLTDQELDPRTWSQG